MEAIWARIFSPRSNESEHLTTDQSDYLMFLLISFCHIGKTAEQLFVEDQNAFMLMFRRTDEELLTAIDIRLSTVEFFDNCIL